MNTTILDRYLPASMRSEVETRYYARVNELARIENMLQDLTLWSDKTHVGWFSDHGVVHVRDVATQILHVLDIIHGVLIPARSLRRFDPFMKAYGTLLAYLHDVGMADFSRFGRAMHPEFAAQAVFDGPLAAWAEQAWEENLGNIAWRLVGLERRGALAQRPDVVFREMLSLSMAHSKSKVPVNVLNDPESLRAVMCHVLSTDLATLYQEHSANKGLPVVGDPATPLGRPRPPYSSASDDAFCWLVSDNAEARELMSDVVDTIRALRCADALRQRGTLHKTSAGYEVFVSLESGNATFAVRQGDQKLYLVEHGEPLSAGEANVASSEVTREGHLRISFHRGAFASEAALRHAVRAAALTVNDIQADVITSFARQDDACGVDPDLRMLILLEAVEDNPSFVDQVIVALVGLNPALASRVRRVPSLGCASVAESTRYLRGAPLDWSDERKRELLARLAQSGQRVEGLDMRLAFEHVKTTTVSPEERLIEAETLAGFVYVPLGEGLVVAPLGGYQAFPVKPYMPLGVTGVIRGAMRNADVIAERPVEVVIIPKEVFLRQWHRPYSFPELRELLSTL